MNQLEALKDTLTDWCHVYVAWSNTDLTEGKGSVVPYVVCKSEATALRLGRKKNVHGADCHVTQEYALKLGQIWLVPGYIRYPSKEDSEHDVLLEKRRKALIKAREAGLSEDEINTLRGIKR